VAFVQKPYRILELARALDAATASAPERAARAQA
jgi:hypothetical protein